MRVSSGCLAVIAATIVAFPAAWADGPADNHPENVRPIPPEGISLDLVDRDALETRLMELNALLDQLRATPDEETQALLPDIEIFHRAVDQALRYDGFFAMREVSWAHDLIDEGLRRAESLLSGDAPWTRETGLVVRGYRSQLDDTVQPFGLVIPEGYAFDGAHSHRCDIWFHGRGERSLELQFIHQRMNRAGTYTPDETIVLHPFGRYSNAFKFAGEVDVLEALEHVRQNYRIDDDRVSVRGFSMGGAACWQFAVHYPDRWFAANPGAGFSETPEFLRTFQGETLDPPWWEEKLWRLYDCPGWVNNLRLLPTIAYSGEIDRQKQAADVMAAAFAQEGMELLHIIGPQTAHKIHPESRVEIERRMDSLAKRGRDRFPSEVSLTTFTLKYNRMHWLTINRLVEHWEPSSATVSLEPRNGDHDVAVTVDGVTDLSLDFPSGTCPLRNGKILLLITERRGAQEVRQTLEVPGRLSDWSWTCRLYRDESGWNVGEPPAPAGVVKRPGLQGPVDDALMSPFLFVTPTGPALNAEVEAWTEAELEHAVTHWRQQMRGTVRMKRDVDVTQQDLERFNLILWGDPASNRLIQQLLPDLPLTWTAETIAMGDESYSAESHAPILVYPNPLNSDRYVVLNSSFTYREYDYLNNARQTPKLPDWAIVDLTKAPGTRWPGRIVAADFFDEAWQVKSPSEADK